MALLLSQGPGIPGQRLAGAFPELSGRWQHCADNLSVQAAFPPPPPPYTRGEAGAGLVVSFSTFPLVKGEALVPAVVQVPAGPRRLYYGLSLAGHNMCEKDDAGTVALGV